MRRHSGAATVLAGLLAAASFTLPSGAGAGPAAGVELRGLGSFDDPVHVAGAPGFPRLLFVAEQRGVIRVLHRSRPVPAPFLDIRALVGCGDPSTVCGEEGLLSVAFPPDYRRSRRFYVYYVGLDGNLAIDEFRRSRERPARAIPGSRRALLGIPHPARTNHNGGQLQFRGELLYIGTGDGGGGGDPPNNAQSRDVLLGKILRIEPRRTRRGRPYAIPRSNPFVGGPGRDEIFSLGLRNPFRFSFHRRARGRDRIVVGDVGQWRYEEVDYTTVAAANGANFGWDAFEGLARYDCGADCPNGATPDPGGTVPPIFVYGHGSYASPGGPSGCSITGGYVVRDRALGPLRGRYVYGDFCAGEIRSLVPGLAGASDEKGTGLSPGSISSFGETPDGRLYVASLAGGVYRIAPAPG